MPSSIQEEKSAFLNVKGCQTRNFLSLNLDLGNKLKRLNALNVSTSYVQCKKKMIRFERLICKSGEANINRVNIESLHRKYMSDIFNTIVDMKWRYLLLMFVTSFLVSWLFFAILWFITEFSDQNCVANLHRESFIDAFLFSIETQQTIGYGFRYITSNCWFTTIILMIQCGFGVVLESFMGGIIFAKLSRPKKRTETLIFSKQAVIAKRDGTYSFMCRVGDMRKSHIISAYVSMYLIKTKYTLEGEIIPWNAQKLDVGHNDSSDRLIFMPTIVEHKIDAKSPLFDLIQDTTIFDQGGSKFKTRDFEIVVILEGTVESTGATTQARTSYLPSEILWDHVFEPLIHEISHMNSENRSSNKATIDFSKFNKIKKLEPKPKLEWTTTKNYSLEDLFSIRIKTPAPTLFSSSNSRNGKKQLLDFDCQSLNYGCDVNDIKENDEDNDNNGHTDAKHHNHNHHHHHHWLDHNANHNCANNENNVHTIDMSKVAPTNDAESIFKSKINKKLMYESNENIQLIERSKSIELVPKSTNHMSSILNRPRASLANIESLNELSRNNKSFQQFRSMLFKKNRLSKIVDSNSNLQNTNLN